MGLKLEEMMMVLEVMEEIVVRVVEEGHVLDVAMAGEPGEGHPEVMKLEVRKQRQRRMEAITAKVT